MTNIEAAKIDPSSVFKKPADILRDKSLSRDEKIELLRRWSYDEREKSVAEEENMRSPDNGKGIILDEILQCLIELGAQEKNSAPTKQG